MKNRVDETREKNLCVSCEACSAVCPVGAIEMEFSKGQYLPKINEEKCINCGICHRVCPGINLNENEILNKEFSVDEIAGHSEAAYISSYKNEEVRKKGASGGVVTGLLMEMLKNKEIEGAFVLGADGTDGKIAKISYVENEKEIIGAAKSKYIPASVYDVIKKIKNNPEKKYAVVGTACQFQALRKFLEIFKISQNRIFFLGLFCDRTLNYNILDYFKDESKIKDKKLIKVDFRNKEKNGWPGDVKLYFKNEKITFINRNKRAEVKDYFQLNRCSFCLDKLNKSADISFGDCYISGESSEEGKTNIIIRSEKGLAVFNRLKNNFCLKETTLDTVAASQRIDGRIINFNRAKNLLNSNGISFRKIKIYIGAYYGPCSRILLKLFLAVKKMNIEIFIKLWLSGGLLFFEIMKHIASYFFGNFSPKKNERLDSVIILGGGMNNKGAQAMTFTVMDKVRVKNPNCKIYLMSSEAFSLSNSEKERYNLEIMPWGTYEKLEIFFQKINLFKKYNVNNKYKKGIFDIFSSADCIFDISGYGIASQFGFFAGLSYVLKIIIAKRFFKPLYLLPQSLGPYSYKFPANLVMKPLLNLYLKYPIKIFIREDDGYQKTSEFTKKNIEKSYDLVIQNKEYNIQNIFSKNYKLKRIEIKRNSVGIIVNMQVIKKMKWSQEDFYDLYGSLVSAIILNGKNVYIIKHSSEDESLNNNIKKVFLSDERVCVINEELNAIELECIISQMDFIIASRYHSIVHAYKNGVPAVAIGWAIKYKELLETFGQERYLFDCRNNLDKMDILDAVSVISSKYPVEKEKIRSKMEIILNESIYDKIF